MLYSALNRVTYEKLQHAVERPGNLGFTYRAGNVHDIMPKAEETFEKRSML